MLEKWSSGEMEDAGIGQTKMALWATKLNSELCSELSRKAKISPKIQNSTNAVPQQGFKTEFFDETESFLLLIRRGAGRRDRARLSYLRAVLLWSPFRLLFLLRRVG